MKTRNSHGLLQLGWEALAYCQCASALISGNKALLVSVDLIGEKNQVILEYKVIADYVMNTVYTTMLIDNYSKCMVFGRKKKIIIIQIESHIVGKKTEKKKTHTQEKKKKKIRKIKNKIDNEKKNYNE